MESEREREREGDVPLAHAPAVCGTGWQDRWVVEKHQGTERESRSL